MSPGPPLRPGPRLPIGGPLLVRGAGDSSNAHRRSVGRFGEDLAVAMLHRSGAEILARNVRIGHGEIDIHAVVGGIPVAVEVKTVVADGPASDAVRQFSDEKAATIRRYAAGLDPAAYRVDLIAVTLRPSAAEVHWVPFAA